MQENTATTLAPCLGGISYNTFGGKKYEKGKRKEVKMWKKRQEGGNKREIEVYKIK